MGARSGAVRSNDNGVNDNNYNDDNRNDNVVAAGSSPSNFCLLFPLFCSAAFNPTAKHAPDFIKSFLKGKGFLLS